MDVNLSAEAKQAWKDFAARHGCSMTSLAEAIAAELERNMDDPSALWSSVIAQGKAIRAEREDRSGG